MTTEITAPGISNQIYYLTNPTLSVPLGIWTENYGGCLPFTYQVTLSDGSPLPAFITFNSVSNTISISSSTESDIAIYDIKIKGSLVYVSKIISFRLTVRPACYVTSLTKQGTPLQ